MTRDTKTLFRETANGLKKYISGECLVVDLNELLGTISALPGSITFKFDREVEEAVYAMDVIRETIRERDDALKEVERITARLALAERVMRNLAKVLCSPRYDRGDGCGDEEKMLANYGWTKEDAE